MFYCVASHTAIIETARENDDCKYFRKKSYEWFLRTISIVCAATTATALLYWPLLLLNHLFSLVVLLNTYLTSLKQKTSDNFCFHCLARFSLSQKLAHLQKGKIDRLQDSIEEKCMCQINRICPALLGNDNLETWSCGEEYYGSRK